MDKRQVGWLIVKKTEKRIKKYTKRTEEPVYVLSEETPWTVKEAYKSMRTNVVHSLPNEGNRIIGFTSAEPQDGKTTNAVNFAISMAQIDKKVLLIDCDLRKPMVAKMLNIDGEPGIADVIFGEARIRDAVNNLSKYGIDVIPAGTLMPDPTLLLQSERMTAVLQSLKKAYDYIVVDFPPVTVVTDAAILASEIDGFLIVVRHEKTDYRSVADMMEQLDMANAKIIGFVYNGNDSGDSHYYKGNYGYRYGYREYSKK